MSNRLLKILVLLMAATLLMAVYNAVTLSSRKACVMIPIEEKR